MNSYYATELYNRFDRDLLEKRERRGESWHYQELVHLLADTGGARRGTLKQARMKVGDFLINSGLKLKGRTEPNSLAPITQVH